MILNIRGTGGAGKSTIVREVMRRYPTVFERHIEGRRQPVGYLCTRDGGPSLFIIGHYATPCGGGDTIKTPGEVYAMAREEAQAGHDVLFEGIISQDDVSRTIQLSEAFPLIVYGLRVPIEECLAGIQRRRDARGTVKPLNPKNTIDRARRLDGTMRRLTSYAVTVQWGTRAEITDACLATLHLAGAPGMKGVHELSLF